jgi:hypothetical protein
MAGGKNHAAASNEMNPLWMEGYHKLVDYHKIHKHCNVTKKEGPTLARWVDRQRGEGNENLTAKSRRLLDELDFQWDITRSTNQEVGWEVQFCQASEVFGPRETQSPCRHHQMRQSTVRLGLESTKAKSKMYIACGSEEAARIDWV